MIRKVFLIGSPLSYEQQIFVEGVKTDIQNYCNYYMSPTGGAYTEQEIIYLENPSMSLIRGTLAVNPAHFATFIFSGHGAVGVDSKNTYLDINSYERVALIDIIKLIRAERQQIITDSCRNFIEESGHLGFGGPSLSNVMDFPSNLSPQRARRLWEAAMERTKPGIQALYSCSNGESSILTSQGSYYANSLLSSVRDWSLKIEPMSILLGVGAHKLSRSEIKNITSKQTPKTYRTDLKANFPFAIRYGSELIRYEEPSTSFDILNQLL
jgi:hypothetical protein